jgi:hypothetical protein
MMPVIRINDAIFDNLKHISKWVETETPSDTIAYLVQKEMERLGIERDDMLGEAVRTTSSGAMQFERTPSLTFTKPHSAIINGKTIKNPNWSAILIAMIAQVKAKVGGGEKLCRELNIQTKTTRHETGGFQYYPELGISVQGQSAADVWKEVERLAKKCGIPVQVEFEWRQNPKAQYPGRTGFLRAGN